MDRNEEFLVTPEILDKMLQGPGRGGYLSDGPHGVVRPDDRLRPEGRQAYMVLIPGPQCMQTIMAASTRARGLESYAYRTWKETLDFLEVPG